MDHRTYGVQRVLELVNNSPEIKHLPFKKIGRPFISKVFSEYNLSTVNGFDDDIPPDIEYIKEVLMGNDWNAEILSVPDLSDAKIERIISLGYLYPYEPASIHKEHKNGTIETRTIRLRMDMVFLSIPFPEIPKHLLYKSEEQTIHKPTHRHGITLLVLTPCIWCPLEYSAKELSSEWKAPERYSRFIRTLPVPYIGKSIRHNQYGHWNPLSNVNTAEISEIVELLNSESTAIEHPFHPVNIKHTLLRNPELLLTIRNRILDLTERFHEVQSLSDIDFEWKSDLNRLLFDSIKSTGQYQPIAFPSQWTQYWNEFFYYKRLDKSNLTGGREARTSQIKEIEQTNMNHMLQITNVAIKGTLYKKVREALIEANKNAPYTAQGACRTYIEQILLNGVDSTKKSVFTSDYAQQIKHLKDRGIKTKVIPLNTQYPFKNKMQSLYEVSRSLTNGYLNSFLSIHQEVRDQIYPQYQQPLTQKAINYHDSKTKGDVGFARVRFKILDESNAMLFFILGCYVFWEEDNGPLFDFYGHTPLYDETNDMFHLEIIQMFKESLPKDLQELCEILIINGKPDVEYVATHDIYRVFQD